VHPTHRAVANAAMVAVRINLISIIYPPLLRIMYSCLGTPSLSILVYPFRSRYICYPPDAYNRCLRQPRHILSSRCCQSQFRSACLIKTHSRYHNLNEAHCLHGAIRQWLEQRPRYSVTSLNRLLLNRI